MIRILSLAAGAALFALPALACDGFGVDNAYARFSTSMSQSGAAFMELHNHGSADCRVTGARSTVSERTELHTHVIDAAGVARMVQVEDGFAVPAGGTHVLTRGADHVMLIGLPQPLSQGQSVGITFIFEDGSEFAFEVPVDNDRMPMAAPQGHSHGHSHGN